MPDEKKIEGKTKHKRVAECKEEKKKNKRRRRNYFFWRQDIAVHGPRENRFLFLPTYSTAYPPYYTVINLRLHPGLIEGRVIDL